MRLRGISVAIFAGLTAMGSAEITSVVPNGFAATNGGGTFLGPLASSPRTYQWLIRDDQLTAHVGRILTGFSLRLPASATANWPTADLTIANFDIRLSESVLPANRSLTFASNVVGAQTQVRSGGLTILQSGYAAFGNPNTFGPMIDFQSGYVYDGGNLLIELRHDGFSGTSRSIDAILATNGPVGVYGLQVSACWTGSYTGTAGSQGNFGVLQLASEPAVTNPSSYVVTSGFEISGNLDSLFASDDDCLAVFPDETTLTATVEIYGTSDVQVPSSLTFTFEGSVARFGLAQSISLRNYSTNTWTEVDGRIAPTVDTTIVVTQTGSAPDFVGSGGAVGARVSWAPVNDEDPSQDGWQHCIDQAVWTIL